MLLGRRQGWCWFFFFWFWNVFEVGFDCDNKELKYWMGRWNVSLLWIIISKYTGKMLIRNIGVSCIEERRGLEEGQLKWDCVIKVPEDQFLLALAAWKIDVCKLKATIFLQAWYHEIRRKGASNLKFNRDIRFVSVSLVVVENERVNICFLKP